MAEGSLFLEHNLIRGDPLRRAAVTETRTRVPSTPVQLCGAQGSWGGSGLGREEQEEEESTQHVVSVFVYISETVITECHTCEWKVLQKKNPPITHCLLPPLLLLISRGGTNVVTTDNADCFSCLFFFLLFL